MIFKLLLKLLEKLGRKWALVDFYGDVIQWRYYIFYTESHKDTRWIAKFPNLFLHVYVGEVSGQGVSPDEANAHSHPYNTWGFIVKGGYTEIINESRERVTGRFGVAHMRYKDHHRISKVFPGTVSLFFHGFRQSEWLARTYPCQTVCQTCVASNAGVCYKSEATQQLDDTLADVGQKLGGRGWRIIRFLKVDKSFNKILANRKRCLVKLGLPPVEGIVQKRELMKQELIKRAKV